MDVVCRPDIPCFCRPLATPALLTEHVLLGSVQLAKALLLLLWLQLQQGAQIAISTQVPRTHRSNRGSSGGGTRRPRTAAAVGAAGVATVGLALSRRASTADSCTESGSSAVSPASTAPQELSLPLAKPLSLFLSPALAWGALAPTSNSTPPQFEPLHCS
ncbi:hypothetical protein T492DRAFT_927599 [Pavlovales sp. CCMP2436]|nr:hypothetical protein T492DRAFT_927599 [Pavlovales sp. CCMP2436]|mmetsp:Transcript_665/g.1744  ORF Transcript_665/g.1744 Transcript_665/m.1744 type:complete len:160 (-) Transcript_665:2552-3031(-)